MGRRKESPLYAACQRQDMKTFLQLLDSGLDVNATTQQTKRTSLHIAASHVNVKLCDLLVAHGASALAADTSGRTPAHLAIESKAQQSEVLQCLRSLLEATPAEVEGHVKQEWLSSLLRCATEHRATECARQLLHYGALDSPHGDKGRCCLHVAAGNGELAILEALLTAHPENACCKDTKGNTPLHIASECGNASAVRSLLAVCSSPRELNSLHQTPLALALSRGHSPVIEAFAEQLLSPSLTAAAATHSHTNTQTPAEHVAPARMSRRATAGRWARMALQDDVQCVQLSAITKDVMASRADPNALIEAAEQGDFVLTQLIIDGGADSASSRRRRRGAVEICLSQMQASRDMRSFQESLIWWTECVDSAAVNGRSQSAGPPSTCSPESESHEERHAAETASVTHQSATCSRSVATGKEQDHVYYDSPETCGQVSCTACWGDTVASAQKTFVLRNLHGRRACLDPVLAAIRGREHLLSDLETTVLVLLSHGAPLSVDLGEMSAVPSAATAPPCSHPTEPWTGARVATAGANDASRPSQSEIKWWLAPEVPEEVHGDGGVLVAACACNSWPLVSAILAIIPPEAHLHRDTIPAALDFAVGALNVPVLHALLEYAHLSKQIQHALGQGGAQVTNLLLRAVTSSVLRKCAPLRLAWSRRTTAAPESCPTPATWPSDSPTANKGDNEADLALKTKAESTDHPLNCIQAAVPSDPIFPVSMQYVQAIAVSETAGPDSPSLVYGNGCSDDAGVSHTSVHGDKSVMEAESLRQYMHPVDETKYANTLSTRVQDIHFLGGGQGMTVVSRTLESLGGTPLQAQWQCAATMHIVDTLVLKILDSDVSLVDASPETCAESGVDVAPGLRPVDWDAVLFVLGKMWAFPRALKPVVDHILCLRHFWHRNTVAQSSHSENQKLSFQGTPTGSGSFGDSLHSVYYPGNALTATEWSTTGVTATCSIHHECETIPFYIAASTVRAGNLFMLQRLWQYPMESVHYGTGVTLLHVAAHCNAPVIARFLIHGNVPHLAIDADGRNALHHVLLSNTNPSATLPRAWQVHISVADVCMPPSAGSPASPDPPVDVHRALSPFSRPPATAPGRVQQTDIHTWLGEAKASEPTASTESNSELHNCLRCLRELVLLEDCGGLAPIDLCPSCGKRYRTSVGMRASESIMEGAGRTTLHGAAVTGQRVAGTESVHRGSEEGDINQDCRCGGVVWTCALEQSLSICSLLVPDAMQAGEQAPKCAPWQSNVQFSDLPKEVRAMICQRSCIFCSSVL